MDIYQNTTAFPNQPLDALDCTLQTCPLSRSIFGYQPMVSLALIPLIYFGICAIGHSIIGIRYKTLSFGWPIVLFCILEVVGYLARYLAQDNPFKKSYYLIQIILLTLAPIFICASIYICLGRIVSVYGKHLSRLPPVWYTIIFVTCDFISLALQGAGGGLTSSATTTDQQNLGIRVMLIGLCFQLATLVIFSVLCIEFAWRVRTQAASLDASTYQLRQRWQWKAFIVGLALALIFVIIRSAYRIAEMSGGYDGSLMNSQWTFLVFEGICMMIATSLLLAFHPGPGFGGAWSAAKVRMGSKSDGSLISERTASDDVEK